jgi:hypothetical protein
MKIPYGMANFADIRQDGYFYADKTRFIPVLEDANTGRYGVLLRPRRSGKSLLLSMLADYYDIASADRFDERFAGLYVHKNPTPLRTSYLVLRLDFSTMDTHAGPERIEATFVDAVRARVRDFLLHYQDLVPSYRELLPKLDGYKSAASLMLELFSAQLKSSLRIFVLIDEYDSFANDLLSQRRLDHYHEVIEGSGFVRTFYKTLKAATGGGPVSRLLATGVSPVALDDMASGFNITTDLTQNRHLNALCGFTRAEVTQAVAELVSEMPELGPAEPIADDLMRYYNGYLFSRLAKEPVCNPDMVLYFLRQLQQTGSYPEDLLDKNVRTDYGKLRRLVQQPGGTEDWQREIIEKIISEGCIASQIVDRFGVRRLYEPVHLVSLLFYMGLLTIRGVHEGLLYLEVPNQVMRQMHWEELVFLLREQAGAIINTTELQAAVVRMAYHGDLSPFLRLIQDRVLLVLSNRDLMHFDEKHIKMLLLSYLSLSPVYRALSEKEVAQGYSDLLLALDGRFPDARYSFLLELKHVKTGATEEQVEAARTEAEGQLARYLLDQGLLPVLLGERQIKAAVVVFIGAKEHRVWMVR